MRAVFAALIATGLLASPVAMAAATDGKAPTKVEHPAKKMHKKVTHKKVPAAKKVG